MTFPIVEIFGFPPDNDSVEADICRTRYWCPFLDVRCIKSGHGVPIPLGTCSVLSSYGPVVTCPKRFYGHSYALIRDVATALLETQSNVVTVSEIGTTPSSTFDWIAVRHDGVGNIQDYHGIEVQSIDITGSVRPYFEAYMQGGDTSSVRHSYGINWANVFKRGMPQFLAKAAILASYGKKLAVVVQDQLLDYINLRSDRMTIEEEPLPHLANVIFFAYRFLHDTEQNTYKWQLDRRLPTSSRRLETAFIAGLLGRVPRRDEFEQAIAERVMQTVNLSSSQS
jgi:hypothetical protein